MDKQPLAEKILFDLFLDAVKRKDKMQFSYFNLYCAIKNAEELTQEDNNLLSKIVQDNKELKMDEMTL